MRDLVIAAAAGVFFLAWIAYYAQASADCRARHGTLVAAPVAGYVCVESKR